jgi:hypothetical protein
MNGPTHRLVAAAAVGFYMADSKRLRQGRRRSGRLPVAPPPLSSRVCQISWNLLPPRIIERFSIVLPLQGCSLWDSINCITGNPIPRRTSSGDALVCWRVLHT